jgi:cation transport regulator
MPYEDIQALPPQLRAHLPLTAQQIYREAFNDAWRQYADLSVNPQPAAVEEAVSRSAWAAVKRQYRLDRATGRWRRMTAM